MRLLLLEDEGEVATLAAGNLRKSGFTVDAVRLIDEARNMLRGHRYDLLLVDLRLPDGDGTALIAELREAGNPIPIICVTGLDAVPDRIRGLEMGADDYVVKPVVHEELVARIRAVLRRPSTTQSRKVEVGGVGFDPGTREVTVRERPLVVPRRELAILELLIQREGRVVQRDAVEAAVYGADEEVQPNTIETHVSRLRKRLGEAGAEIAIHGIRGLGYMLEAKPAA
jgi:DNA-binding response OmpR family regulator